MANPAEFPEKAYRWIRFPTPGAWTKATDANGKRVYTATEATTFSVGVVGEATPQQHSCAAGTVLRCWGGYVEIEVPE